MKTFKKVVEFFTLGSARPVRRLLAYYAVMGIVMFTIVQFLPAAERVVSGAPSEKHAAASLPLLLQNGQESTPVKPTTRESPVRVTAAQIISRTLRFLATLALMLPVSWVYMSAHRDRTHSQEVAQTLLILPMVVAGVILVVRDSLALAFSLAGVVAAVRFRTTLSDARDLVFIFLAIAVGFATGVEELSIAVLLTVIFNFVLLLVWRYDFGRTVLAPTAATEWAEPLAGLVHKDIDGRQVPDRELVLALTPKKVDALAERFKRVKGLIGADAKKPRYNAILTVTTDQASAAQQTLEPVLNANTKRWKLDEVVSADDKPSELFYLIKTRKSIPRDALLTEIQTHCAACVHGAHLEVGDAVELEQSEDHDRRKMREKEVQQ